MRTFPADSISSAAKKQTVVHLSQPPNPIRAQANSHPERVVVLSQKRLFNSINECIAPRSCFDPPMKLVAFTLFAVASVSSLPAADANTAHRPPGSRTLPAMPPATSPVMFDTPEADRIVAALQIFPPDNPWNTDISKWPVHPNSQNIVASIGAEKPLRYNPDMGYVIVPPAQAKVAVKITGYPDESDRTPFPVPDKLPIEGWPAHFRRSAKHAKLTLDDVQRDTRKQGGDRHATIVDPINGMLYELYQARKTDDGWSAAQTSIFDLKSNKLRPEGWTSTDAAGLPLFPAIVRHDELQRGEIEHALRVTVRRSRRAYVAPATHFASRLTDTNLPRMGERLRLKADFDITRFSPPVQTILKALKKYGMLVADNGIEWAISVAPDERIPVLNDELRRIQGAAFEVVEKPR